MNLTELYAQTPRERHGEIAVSEGRVFFGGEEYTMQGGGELKLVRSFKALEQRLAQVAAKLGIPQ